MSGLMRILFGSAISENKKKGTISLSKIEEFEKQMSEADEWLKSGAKKGHEGFGWLNLPYQDVSSLKEHGKWLSGFESIIQIGIGGSALGNRMLNNALLHPFYNGLSPEKRKGPRYYLAENVDPDSNNAIWEMVDPDKTALLVISKSGSTAETMANFLFFFNKMQQSLDRDETLKRVLVITDPEKGTLRSLVNDTGCRSLEVPPGVGGRYSVLSPVGLSAASAVGIDIDDLLEGAREAHSQLSCSAGILDNPAHILSTLTFLHYREGRNINVLMPYTDSLNAFVEWYAQLWAESIGKEGKGSTPVRALGAVDQHSQVQLYTEGPDDKLFTLINVEKRNSVLTIPHPNEGSLSPLGYMGGKDMSQMIGFEARSTASAIVASGKPVIWIDLPDLSAKTLGGLIFFYQYATAVLGYLLSINPFDQPGVEQGKKYTYGLMGRKGFEDSVSEVEKIFNSIESLSANM